MRRSAASSAAASTSRTCSLSALARASAKDSPAVRPAASAAAFKAAICRPPLAAIARTKGRSGSTGLLVGASACAARKRVIGQRGSQTETMRDMIVLHLPFPRTSVAAAFKLQVPARSRDKPETVAHGFRHTDAPARRRGAGFERLRRPDEKQRQAGIARGELQFLAGLQIEPVDHPDDRLWHTRMQSLRHGPEGFFPVRRLDQSDADRIEAEAVETMSAKAAMVALPIGRHDEEEGAARRQAAQPRHDETEGGRKRACRFRYDLMQGAAGEAALRQMGIDGGQAEGQGAVDI